MFNLKKDIDKYQGIPPYASELYGVHQALLGWRSRMTKDWLARRGLFTDPRVLTILSGRVTPGPLVANLSDRAVQPLVPGSPKSPFNVLLTKDWTSELMILARDRVQEFVDRSGGRLPKGDEWQKVVERLRFSDANGTALKTVQERWSARLSPPDQQTNPAQRDFAQTRFLAVMQFESQIADFCLSLLTDLTTMTPTTLPSSLLCRKLRL